MGKKAQLENGYTKIANDLVDALAKSQPGFTEGQVLWSVIRKTYGWHKKSDKISISQLVKMTGKSRRMVIYAIQNLEAKNMILVSRSFQQVNEITFNKNYNDWVGDAKSNQYQKLHLVQKVAPSATNGKNLVQHSVNDVPKVAPTKETITKETIQNNIINNITKEKSFGNQDINLVIDLLKKQIGSPILDGSIKVNRQYANLLIKKSKTGVDGVKWLIGLINAKDRYCPTVGSTKDLYYKTNKLVQYRGGKDQNQDGKRRGYISYEDFIKMADKDEQ